MAAHVSWKGEQTFRFADVIGMYVEPLFFCTRLINGWVTIIPPPSLHSSYIIGTNLHFIVC